MQPRAVSELEDKELASMMERYEQENLEVAGDEDGEEDEDGLGVAAAE